MKNEAASFVGYWSTGCLPQASRSVLQLGHGRVTTIEPPLLTYEAVISEACFLLRRTFAGEETVLSLIADGYIQISFRLDEEVEAIRELMKRYRSVPMALADACLVQMAEEYKNSAVLTLDRDFQIYRKDRNQAIPIIMPAV